MKYILQSKNGFYRVPFAFLGFPDLPLPMAREKDLLRSIENLNIFPHSLIEILKRIKEEIESSKTRDTALQLFLDTQSLFVFGEQFLQDIGIVLRMFVPKESRHNLSPKFHKQRKQLHDLEYNKELQEYLKDNEEWFSLWKDLRDDISHRTLFDRTRKLIFPDLLSFRKVASGEKLFINGSTLKQCLTEYIDGLLTFACVVENFIKARYVNLKNDYFVDHEIALVVFHEQFTPGVGGVVIGEENIKILDWWFKDGSPYDA